MKVFGNHILISLFVGVSYFYGGYRYRFIEELRRQVPTEEALKSKISKAQYISVEFDSVDADEIEVKSIFIDKKEIVDQVIDLIKIDEDKMSKVSYWKWDNSVRCFHDMCDGDFRIHFMGEGGTIAVVSLHHMESLRWLFSDWEGDARLVEGSGYKLYAFLEDQGVTGVKYFMGR